jgi:murein DD-endopeptidase MepM/ murein hydrolase activator NlpD
MTQRHKSADNRLDDLRTQGLIKRRFASTLSAQSLGWLSSVSLLSGGLVFAQTESSVDNIVPTIENSQPIVVKDTGRKETAAEATPSEPDFAERRVRLKKKLHQTEVSQSAEPVRTSKPKVENSEPKVTERTSEPKVENSESKVTERTSEPKVETPANSVAEKPSEVAQPPNNSNDTGSRTTAGKNKDYNNALVDPTDYNNTPTGKYEAPSSVTTTERGGGCQAVFSQKEIAAGACGKKPIDGPRVADSPKKTAPTWIQKSETASLEKAPRFEKVAAESKSATPSVVKTVASAVNNNTSWRNTNIGSSSHTKTAYRPNRFIPNPSEFSPTTIVNGTPIAPSFGTLPPPMADDNVAPRVSTISYDFALASVLPQIPYSNTLGYRSGSGMMFPLSFTAPITSVFGWRVHPITGDRRFHAGTDLGAPTGTPILAAAKGQVETADWMGGYGLAVTINHNSAQQTLYGHMSEIFVSPGQSVEPGTVIGRVGSTGNSTGPHLHFEVRHLTQNGWVAVDPGVQLQPGLSNTSKIGVR